MEKLFTKKNLILLLAVVMTAILVLTLFVFRLGIADNGSLSSQLQGMGLYDASGASTAVACKTLREMILLLHKQH